MRTRGDEGPRPLLPWSLARVEGSSMQPTLRAGDRLLCRTTDGGEVRPGQVVVAHRPDRPGLLVVKRAVHRDRGGWWLEGDHEQGSHDSWVFGPVPDSAVVARVVLRLWPRPRRV